MTRPSVDDDSIVLPHEGGVTLRLVVQRWALRAPKRFAAAVRVPDYSSLSKAKSIEQSTAPGSKEPTIPQTQVLGAHVSLDSPAFRSLG